MDQQIPLVDLKAQFNPLKNDIFKAWEDVMSGMHLFLGPNVQAFETEFANYCGVKYAIGVSDGTKAVYLALLAAGIGPGDEVITVSHTFIATTEAILLTGAKPVFVDIDPDTYLMNADLIEEKVTAKTRAIVPVHLYGQCADMDRIMEIANRHGLYVVEDACQAHGSEYKGRKAGSMGNLGAFSFYFTKNLGAYGEGGMITTNDPELNRKIRMLRDHGSEKRYYHEMVGWNARIDELQAAALRIKLPYLDKWNEQRRNHASFYNEALKKIGVISPKESKYNRHVYHLYVIRTATRDELKEWLNQRGIGTGIHYPVPVHMQHAYQALFPESNTLPVTEKITAEIISLPMYPDLTLDQLRRVITAIEEFSVIKV
jgi:dTDP-4-amino-4,6-dideoxygalactose transaminase